MAAGQPKVARCDHWPLITYLASRHRAFGPRTVYTFSEFRASGVRLHQEAARDRDRNILIRRDACWSARVKARCRLDVDAVRRVAAARPRRRPSSAAPNLIASGHSRPKMVLSRSDARSRQDCSPTSPPRSAGRVRYNLRISARLPDGPARRHVPGLRWPRCWRPRLSRCSPTPSVELGKQRHHSHLRPRRDRGRGRQPAQGSSRRYRAYRAAGFDRCRRAAPNFRWQKARSPAPKAISAHSRSGSTISPRPHRPRARC